MTYPQRRRIFCTFVWYNQILYHSLLGLPSVYAHTCMYTQQVQLTWPFLLQIDHLFHAWLNTTFGEIWQYCYVFWRSGHYIIASITKLGLPLCFHVWCNMKHKLQNIWCSGDIPDVYILDLTSLNLFQSTSFSDFLCYLLTETTVVFLSGHAMLK